MIPALKYFLLTIKHKYFVFVAGRKLGVGVWQLLIHDLSKFSRAELPAYGRQFFGDGKDSYGFAVAWLHHQNLNPHHWEYWMPRTGHVKLDSNMKSPPPLRMPLRYAREMVADWMGASKGYTGSWDMEKWLDKNWPRISENLHPETQKFVAGLIGRT